MLAMLPGLLALVPEILALLKGKSDKDVDLKKLDVELQRLFMEKGNSILQAEVSIALKQAEINLAGQQTGNSGPRNFVFWVAAILWAFGFGTLFLAATVYWVVSSFGVHAEELRIALVNFPYGALSSAEGMVTLLIGGLYKVRADEKLQYVKASAGVFNAKQFFDTLKARVGRPLTQDEVDNFNRAIQAALK